MNEARRTHIRSIALDRDVRFLLHFTQAANLTGVVKHGLWPRRDLAAADHLAYASDYGRLDGNKDAVSVSILCVSEPRFAGGEEERRDLAPHFPTDREAEVQVFQRIEADHIPGAIVGQPGLAEPVRATLKWLSGRLRQVKFQDFGLV